MLRLPGPTLALSPDGRTLAFVGTGPDGQQLFLRRLGTLDVVAVSGTEGAASPFFSFDGEWIGFYADRELKRVPTGGGAPVVIADASGQPLGATWLPDGRIVFSTGYRAGLSIVPASGGTPEPFTTLDAAAGEVSHRLPHVLPHSRAVLFTAMGESGWRVLAQDLETGQRTHVLDGVSVQPAAGGHLVYGDVVEGSGATLFSVEFDDRRLEARGSARSVLEGVAARVSGVVHCALSRSGTLAYVPGSSRGTLVLIAADGAERAVPIDGESFGHPRFSPDGTRLAVAVSRSGQTDVWVYDLAADAVSRLTFDGGASPVWTPDGTGVTFGTGSRVGGGEGRGIRTRRVDGRGDHRVVTTLAPGTWHSLSDWVASGDTLVFVEAPDSVMDVSIVTDGERQILLQEPGVELRGGRVSPDGRWMAFQSDESGRHEIYITTFPDTDGRWQISTIGGTDPVWSRDGTELYYASEERLVAARIAFQPSVRVTGHRVVLDVITPRWFGDYDVHPDGDLFVVARLGGAPVQREIRVVLNWLEQLP
ncbi:MAG: hypothetical protein PVH40_04215 [Gemmatimonadales bacterium]